ncbi:MAG: (Fe-S)-binding protein [Ilumatobacteraceae bacterium]
MYEFSSFVAQHHLGLPDDTASSPGATSSDAPAIDIAYHHSCHMLRELHVEDAPIDALRAAGVTAAAWPADRECCGFGGLFAVKLPETSVAMADRKLDTVPEGCGTVVGCDASCLLHLSARSEARGSTRDFRHLAELLDERQVTGIWPDENDGAPR